MKTCKECFHKCKAQCCTFVPLTIKFVEENKHKFQRKVYHYSPHPNNLNLVYPVVEIDKFLPNGIPVVSMDKQICPFLDKNHRCVVYDKRPEICRIYGTTTEPDCSLTCGYHLGKDYSYPKDNTPEKQAMDDAQAQGKYITKIMGNQKLIKEFFGF